MPKNIDDCVAKVKKQLIDTGKAKNADAAERKAHAICKASTANLDRRFRFTTTFKINESMDGKMEEEDGRLPIFGVAATVGPSRNYNLFREEVLKKSTKSLRGRTVFLNHDSHDVRQSVGKITKAKLVEKDLIYVGYVDAIAEPTIAQKIKSQVIDSVSIGAWSIGPHCTICGKSKIRGWFGIEFGECQDHELGKEYEVERDGKKRKEICYIDFEAIEFFELSLVGLPGINDASVHSSLALAVAEAYKPGEENIPETPPIIGVGTERDNLISIETPKGNVTVDLPPTVVDQTPIGETQGMGEPKPQIDIKPEPTPQAPEPQEPKFSVEDVKGMVTSAVEAGLKTELTPLNERIGALESEKEELETRLGQAEAQTAQTQEPEDLNSKIVKYLREGGDSSLLLKAGLHYMFKPDDIKSKFEKGNIPYLIGDNIAIVHGGK